MPKANPRRLPVEEMVDLARRLVLKATADLHVDPLDEPHVQAREYARAASAAGHFRGSPPARQDSTTRGHLASRFERRLTPLAGTTAELREGESTRPHVVVKADPDPVYVDAADLSVLDAGLRIVAEDAVLFDRVAVRDLAPPPHEADRHVILDVLRSEGRILVGATAISNAVYGMAGVHLDDQGAIVETIEPTGAHDVTPLDEEVLERLWTIIGAGARNQGRSLPKAKKIKAVTVTDGNPSDAIGDADVPSPPAADIAETRTPENASDVEDDDGEAPLPALIERDAGPARMMRPISVPPLTTEGFEPYSERMAANAVTRILLDVMAFGLVEGRLPVVSGDVVTSMYVENYRRRTDELLAQLRRRYRNALTDPSTIGKYEDAVAETHAKTLTRAKADAAEPIGLRFNILLRLLAMHAQTLGAIETADACDGDGDAFLGTDETAFGILVIKDRTFFDVLRQTQEDEDGRTVKTRREVPVSVIYRLNAEGAFGVVHQMDARHTNVLLDFDLPAAAPDDPDEEAEVDWYLRNILRDAAARRRAESAERLAANADIGNAAAIPTMDAETHGTSSDAAALVPARPFTHGIPTDRRMRRHAQVSLGVTDYAQVAEVVDKWFDRTAKGHKDALMLDRRCHDGGWRIEHASDDDAHVWAVSVTAGPQDPPRVEVVVETTQTRADAALPGVVREIAAAVRTTDLDGPIELEPGMVMARPQMRALMEELTDPARQLPVLVLTTDANGDFMVDPAQTARRTAGYLRVRTVSPTMTREMRDAWGQEFTVFNGAARIYQPGFDPERSNPLAHQRFMPGVNAHHTLNNAIKREAAATLSRYRIDDSLGQDLDEAARLAAEVRVEDEAPALPLPTLDLPPPVRFRPVERKPQPKATETRRNAGVTIATEDEGRSEPRIDTEAPEVGKGEGPGVPPEPASDRSVSEQDTSIRPDVDRPDPEHPTLDEMVVVPIAEPGEHPATDDAGKDRPDAATGDAVSVAAAEVETGTGTVAEAEVSKDEPVSTDIGTVIGPDEAESDRSAGDEAEEPDAELPLDDDLEARIARVVARAMERQNVRIEAIETHIAKAERERDSALRQVDAVRERALAAARVEKEESDRYRNDDAELIRIAEQERDDALSELLQTKADLDEQVARNRMLEREIERLRAGASPAADRPQTLADIGDWANSRFAGRLALTSRACKALRKSNYADVERTVQMIELFAGPYVDARSRVDGAHDRWLAGLEALRVKDHKQLDAGGPEDQQYHVRHEGRVLRLDRHVKGNESSGRDRGAFRVYYTYDEQSGQVVIGWLPDHLTTAAT